MPDTTGLCERAEARIRRNVDQLAVVAECARQACSDDLFEEVIAALAGSVYA